MQTSDYLLDTVKEHIEGKTSIKEVQQRIYTYYEEQVDNSVQSVIKDVSKCKICTLDCPFR